MPITWLESWLENEDSWFDLVACCYSKICHKGLNLPQFLLRFGDELRRKDSVLDNAIDDISAIVIDSLYSFRKDRERVLQKIRCCLNLAFLRHSSSPIDIESILCWVMIAGIDKAFSNLGTPIDVKDIGPLNSQKQDEVGVHYKAEDSAIKRILSAYGIKQSPEGRLSERLQVFDLVERIDSFPLPAIKRPPTYLMNLKKDSTLSGTYDVSLRIGVAACVGIPLFGKEDRDRIVYKCSESGVLSFQYSLGYEERYDEIVGRSLQKAIDSDCDIVVFPELVMSPAYIKKL